VPYIDATYKKFRGEKFELISISTETEGNRLTKKWIAEFIIPYPVVMATKDTLTAFKFKKTPLFLIIDKEGRIQKRFEGFDTQIHSDIEKEIERLLKG